MATPIMPANTRFNAIAIVRSAIAADAFAATGVTTTLLPRLCTRFEHAQVQLRNL